MEKQSYSDLIQGLQGFDPWLISLGLTPRRDDRIHEAFKVLERAEEASRRGRETGNYVDIGSADWFPMIEAMEAHDVFTAFREDSSSAFRGELKRALSGPAHPILEGAKNRDGRNIWFQLALAADWELRGAEVSVGEPDLRLTRDETTFLVACKRPDTFESIEGCIASAAKQLRRNLSTAAAGSAGVVAISLTRVFNAGDRVFTGDLDALQSNIDHVLNYCRDSLVSIRDERICCVIFHVATPGVAESGVDLVRASFAIAQELRPSSASKIFERHTRAMKQSSKQQNTSTPS